MKKLAVTKHGKDILRIIPIIKANSIELKIKIFPQCNLNFLSYLGKKTDSISSGEEITYHNSRDNKNPKVHVKTKDGKYRCLFEEVVDIEIDNIIPFPIFKMNIADLGTKIYKEKKENRQIELEENSTPDINTFELYLVNDKYEGDPSKTIFRCLDLLRSVFPIDYLISDGADYIETFKYNLSRGPICLMTGIKIGKYIFLCKHYIENNIKENTISFYENKYYFDLIITTPMCIELDGKLSAVMPAYLFDLDEFPFQNEADMYILDKWRKIFGDSENKIKDLKFKRKTILIQRTWE